MIVAQRVTGEFARIAHAAALGQWLAVGQKLTLVQQIDAQHRRAGSQQLFHGGNRLAFAVEQAGLALFARPDDDPLLPLFRLHDQNGKLFLGRFVAHQPARHAVVVRGLLAE
jgi:hypothetical protein